MNKRPTFLLTALFCLLAATALRADSVPVEIPEGMEAIPMTTDGGGQLVVPKGSRTCRVGAQIIVEGTKEYMSRRFEELDARLTALEQENAELINENNQIKKNVEALEESLKENKGD